jgi:anti-sigma regulatory factor (Ser/Thr protein kinase)
MPQKNQIIEAIVTALKAQPNSNPSADLQTHFQITRETMRRYFNQLIDQGIISAHGYGKGRSYSLLPNRAEELYVNSTKDALANLGESQFYRDKIEPLIKDYMSVTLAARVAYVVTECLNNIIDHSRARSVFIGINVEDENLILKISDDGIGALASIQAYFHLTDPMQAISELAKGKRTTDPSSHAGEGLFFSSRIADHFKLSSNGISYIYVDDQGDWAIAKSEATSPGTEVMVRFKLHSTKTAKSVFDRFTKDLEFNLQSPRLINPYQLSLPPGALIARSEAKKMLAGAEDFKSIILDFKLVEMIGQGFAHEVFVVFANNNPGVEIGHKNANEFVLKMIRYVTLSRG